MSRFYFATLRAALVAFVLSTFGTLSATEYYVDATKGNDDNPGTSIDSPWKTLARVSEAEELKPGDVVRFRSGEVWREGLAPRSGAEGEPIVYTSYGKGRKPSFWRSVSLADSSAWIKVGENIWATRPAEIKSLGAARKFLSGKWTAHNESGAKVRSKSEDGTLEIEVEKSGTAGNHIQVFNAPFEVRRGASYRVSFNYEASDSEGATVSLMKSGSPWTGYGSVVGDLGPTSGVERRTLVATATTNASDARLTLYLGRVKDGARLRLSDMKIEEIEVDSFEMGPDVGNIILDGKKAAWKRWTREDLKSQDDFCYEQSDGRVYYYSAKNPGELYGSMEAAVMRHIIDLSGVKDAVFDGLDLRYGAAHGFGGSGNARVTIRNCDISWIGGGDQYRGGGAGRRVRYGNGIEFWASARDHVVENCRIWEVYDAAITNQGSGTNVESNIVYRNNLIWNCEYSFEYWNRDETSVTEKIRFVDNVCLNAGYGWGHIQRPDPNGRCLMFYSNTAQTRDFVLTGNIFANATESLVRSDVEWKPEEPTLDKNVYWQDAPDATYVLWRKEKFDAERFDEYRKATRWESTGKIERVDVKSLVPADCD